MEKVGIPDNMLAGFVPGLAGRAPRGERKPAKERLSFRSLLGKAEETEAQDAEEAARSASGSASLASPDLEHLLDDVHRLGDALARDLSGAAILAYKEAVRAFIQHVVSKVYALEERSSGGNILKRKKYMTLAVIDSKLERLAADILAGQREKLEILRKVDEIAGLLVDLLT